MIIFSGIYIFAVILFYQQGFGDTSLVYANIVNLSARILYARRFIFRYFSSQHIRWRQEIAPSNALCFLSALSWAVLNYTGRLFGVEEAGLFSSKTIIHVGLGGLLALVNVGVWWYTTGKYRITRSIRKSE